MRAALARSSPVRLRPHLKTSKSVEVALEAFAGFRGGTVSTLEEAAYFLERGIDDLVYAVPIVPTKLDRVAELGRRGSLAVITDDAGVARAIAERGAALGTCFDAYVEIDSGQHRTGTDPAGPELIEIGKALCQDGARLRGVLTHAGQSYGCESIDEIRAVAREERSAALLAAERLRAAGLPCAEVSIGSTPSVLHAESLEGITEVRPGVYVFGDLHQAVLGSCTRDDIALSVLSTVVSRRPGAAWIDAGSLALTQDRSLDQHGGGFGEVCTLALGALGARVDRLNQAHGRISCAPSEQPELVPGARVRVLPNHACLTSAMFDRYHVVDGGGPVVAEWPRLRG